MAVTFRVPKQHHRALKLLTGLGEEQFSALVRALDGATPVLRAKELAAAVPDEVVSDDEDKQAVLSVLVSLFLMRTRLAASLPEFITDVCTAIDSVVDDDLKPRDGNWVPFQVFLKEVLTLDRTLGATAKALGLMLSNERRYCNARVVSDLRPIFPEAADQKPVASVVIHCLEIEFHPASDFDRTEKIFIVIDREDLDELKTAIDRAIKKHESLRELSEQAGVPCLGANHEC